MKMTKLLALTAALALGSVSAAFAQVAQVNVSPLSLAQAAVFTGGVTTQGPVVGGNLWGITRLPRGTELVSGLPVGERAIILPGMVGMPSLAQGCNVQVVAESEPSALSLISANTSTQARPVNISMRQTRTRTESRVIQHKRVHRRMFKSCEAVRRHHIERRLVLGKRGEAMIKRHHEQRRLFKGIRHKLNTKNTQNKNGKTNENSQNNTKNENNGNTMNK